MEPECDLLGVTTVSGESRRRAMLASTMIEAAGRDIPVIPGVEDPLLVEPRQTTAQQAIRLVNWPHKKLFLQRNAISFMAETILSNHVEVTLLAIGPLTNIAMLFTVYPEVKTALSQLVLMCGEFFPSTGVQSEVEWNALLDPHAAAMVYRAEIGVHRSIGLDVTKQVKLSSEEVQRRFKHPIPEPVKDFAEIWFRDQEVLIFHDPLAAVTIFDPSICQFSRGQVIVNVDPSSGPLGLTPFLNSMKQDQIKLHQQLTRISFLNLSFGYLACNSHNFRIK